MTEYQWQTNNSHSLDICEKPKKGDCVRKGPHWEDYELCVKEGIVESSQSTYGQRTGTTTTLKIKWENVDKVHQYTWERHRVELVLQ